MQNNPKLEYKHKMYSSNILIYLTVKKEMTLIINITKFTFNIMLSSPDIFL